MRSNGPPNLKAEKPLFKNYEPDFAQVKQQFEKSMDHILAMTSGSDTEDINYHLWHASQQVINLQSLLNGVIWSFNLYLQNQQRVRTQSAPEK